MENQKKKYKTCKHAERYGKTAVYVYPTCPKLTRMHGKFVSSKNRCMECEHWEKKRFAGDESK